MICAIHLEFRQNNVVLATQRINRQEFTDVRSIWDVEDLVGRLEMKAQRNGARSGYYDLTLRSPSKVLDHEIRII